MAIIKKIVPVCIFSFYIIICAAQNKISTEINYVIRVDSTDLSGYDIEMHIRNAPKTFHLAMATHHEYDDRYWRYVENFSVEPGKNNYVREDSALWRVTLSGKDAIIKYRIHLPLFTGTQRPAWQPFLSPTGGMIGDMHSFMYMVEQMSSPSFITFQLPKNWQIATGLEPTKDPGIFYSPDAKTLLDCPALVGKFETWNFSVNSIPHTIVYWKLPRAIPFDTNLLVTNIKKIVQQTIKLFDAVPYKHYTFLLQDGAYGALEHSNSVPIGIPSATFTRDIAETNNETAHEFFHTWNLMSLRPAQYSDLNYGAKEKAKGLWWSEGLSIFYADVLARRANIDVYDSTRTTYLEKLINRYFSNQGNAKVSPEKASLEANEQPGGLGDYSPSVHVQGAILGAMLDLIIRDATNGKHSIDDVMRKVFQRFSGKKGFHAKDIEQTVKDVCDCDINYFFENYIYNAKPMNFNRYLKLMGREVKVSWKPATDNNGKPYADWQVNIFTYTGDTSFTIMIYNPESCWAKAGLHTKDKVVLVNDMPITSVQSFRNIQRQLQVGDTVTVTVKRDSEIRRIVVPVTGYHIPSAQITVLKNITPKQERIFREWNALK